MEVDDFDRKRKKHPGKKDKKSKRKLSIYDEFEDEGLEDYLSGQHDFSEKDDI